MIAFSNYIPEQVLLFNLNVNINTRFLTSCLETRTYYHEVICAGIKSTTNNNNDSGFYSETKIVVDENTRKLFWYV